MALRFVDGVDVVKICFGKWQVSGSETQQTMVDNKSGAMELLST